MLEIPRRFALLSACRWSPEAREYPGPERVHWCVKMRPMRSSRKPTLALALGALLSLTLACSKDLPSSPAPGAGTPVIVTGNARVGASRNIVFEDGEVLNQSGYTIYNVRVVIVVWRDAPFNAESTDTSAVLFTSMANTVRQGFGPLQVAGDAFRGASAVYSLLP